ncbi:hypothetical protein ISN45_Aa03g031640 [Arabidopsis thaliana x Arabidopsis arenosa]|uniref:DUF1985 domain-containing protein n=1 Tax=Arabidopsis thaliana x Arabidopsis arenosa TaxID=1240361 RepID=A0A8T2B4T7_9BRAS|nr:hypothetical protein ISN45_Aa03g031640 [Arabidopsis thaliana x Arabidopsis arenosa]
MTTTRGRGYSSRRERLSSPRRSKRLKQSDPNQSELPAIVDDVVEDQGDASAYANDVSDHEKKRESWFVVNDIPIRCSMREHALVTGFGSYDFVERVFGTRGVTVSDVEKMLQSMEDACGRDRLQVAVLLFLCTIVKGGRRFNSIQPIVLKIVNDLEEVKKFPWGRITFEDIMNQIDHLMKKRLNCKVKVDHLFGGFIVPLAVFHLKKSTKRLGTTKDIISIMQPLAAEEALMQDIMERGEAEDSLDPIADAWTERLDVQHKKICWEDLHKMDVDDRGCGEGHNLAAEHMEEPQQNVPAAEQKEEELLTPYLLNRMVKTAVAETMKDVYLRLEKLERAAEGRKDGEEAETSEKTEDLSTRLEKLERAAEARKAKGKDEEEKKQIGDDTLDDESGFEKNVEPAVGGDDTLDDESVGGQKTGGDEVAELEMVGEKETGGEIVKKQKFKKCAKKKCKLAPKRTLKPSIYIREPYTEETAKKEKKKEKENEKEKEKKEKEKETEMERKRIGAREDEGDGATEEFGLYFGL